MSNWWEQNDAEVPEFDALPIDNYTLEVSKAEVKHAKSGTLMAACEFTVVGEHDKQEGRKVWDNLMLEGGGVFKIAALVSALCNPQKTLDENDRVVDIIDGDGEMLYMNYDPAVAGLKDLIKSIPVGSDNNPIATTEAEEIWRHVCAIIVGKEFQAATNLETDEYGTKARIGRFSFVPEKTLAKWRTKAAAQSQAVAGSDVPDDDLPF